MNVVDPRTRSKVVLEGGVGRTARSDLTQTVASNTLFFLALCFGKAALSDAGVLCSVVQITAVGAIGGFALGLSRGQRLTGKSVEWSVAGLASLLLSIRLCAVLFALTRLSAVRTAIICQFSSVWMVGLLNNVSRPHALFIVAPIALSFLSDAPFSVSDLRHTVPGYLALAVEAVSSSTLDHTQGVLLPSLGPFVTSVITIAGAFILSSAGTSLPLLRTHPF
ncbi:hypothetical protein PHLGIDRAFT_149421 [Phlebiopsis gigantea 11061_1 CR5-6]|uniref:Uncharacterized protein n=1 Tax=Phlebiopsis gigantea (strain 11061_1 CR5-6) TaxID=745531 RepID=A0A0C3PHT3_PHLG1|nr:hypothetical protein PHLGIDRAFT_149421 [Phlebiopsis gigantea 11061_1 CR5-6]